MNGYSIVTEYTEGKDTFTLWRKDDEPKKVVRIKNFKKPKKYEYVDVVKVIKEKNAL